MKSFPSGLTTDIWYDGSRKIEKNSLYSIERIFTVGERKLDQQEPKAVPTPINVKFSDTSTLPIQHVNTMGIHSGSDEFFLTLGVVVPPDQGEAAKVLENGYIVAQPIYRFAVSRDTMAKFIEIMEGQYKQQTALIKELQKQRTEIRNEGEKDHE
jgi:hypothetical protein